jgi:predicted cupin superfamily sugar epimerase
MRRAKRRGQDTPDVRDRVPNVTPLTGRAGELIRTLGLEPHPEGGYYREIFRSSETVVPPDGRGARSALTTIYYLLAEGTASRWHRVSSDEVWHLYEGGPLELLEIDDALTTLTRHRLAAIGDEEGAPVYTIPSGNWQAARSLGAYTLVGCTVGPGFDFTDFRMMSADADAAARVRVRWPEMGALV